MILRTNRCCGGEWVSKKRRIISLMMKTVPLNHCWKLMYATNVKLSNFTIISWVSYSCFYAQVRASYLYHLRQSLRKNLESSKQKNVCDIEENMINKVIKGCSALLEEKALRSCMIARLYQRVMAQTVSIAHYWLLWYTFELKLVD